MRGSGSPHRESLELSEEVREGMASCSKIAVTVRAVSRVGLVQVYGMREDRRSVSRCSVVSLVACAPT